MVKEKEKLGYDLCDGIILYAVLIIATSIHSIYTPPPAPAPAKASSSLLPISQPPTLAL